MGIVDAFDGPHEEMTEAIASCHRSILESESSK